MKLNFDIKNKKGGFEADVEKLVEKGMDQHDKNWKDKFNTKHNAKKEILEIKHKQQMEVEEQNAKKKNWFQKMEEEKRKTRELELQIELEEKRKKEEEEKRLLEEKKRISTILGVIGSILLIIGYSMGSTSPYGNASWDGLTVVGFLALISIAFVWKKGKKKENKKEKKKKK